MPSAGVRRPGSRADGLDIESIAGDLREPGSLDRAAAGCGLVFHVAADYRLWARDPRELYLSNVDGTRNLLEMAPSVKTVRGSNALYVFTLPKND